MDGRSEEPIDPFLSRLLGVRIDFLQTKTGVAVTNIAILRRTLEEATILEDMGLWLCISGTQDDDPFLTRYGLGASKSGVKSRRTATGGDCSKMVKDCAELHGFPRHLFGSSSCRKATVTLLSASGATKGVIHGRTGHSDSSTVSDTHYNYALAAARGGRGASVGPAASTNTSALSVEDLRRLLPAGTGESNSTLSGFGGV